MATVESAYLISKYICVSVGNKGLIIVDHIKTYDIISGRIFSLFYVMNFGMPVIEAIFLRACIDWVTFL